MLSMFDAFEPYVAVKTITAAASIGIGAWLLYKQNASNGSRALTNRAAAKVHERNLKKWKVLEKELTEDEEALCNLSAGELQRRMASKLVSCEAVISAFCRKARRDCFTDGLNAITEEFYDEAVAEARRLDQQVTPEMWKDARYPLLGLPISVKDHFRQKGADSTSGMASRCYLDGPSGAPQDGVIVQLVREAGGIPFVRSNVPQMMMTPECANNVWGKTTNPFNADRTCGGSSGGEAALIGSHSSVIGLGSDIGGSVRIPAMFCGIYGFVPTNARVTKKGLSCIFGKYSGNIIVTSVPGALSTDVDGCAKVMRVMYSPACWALDPTVPHMPWNDTIYRMGGTDGKGKKKLRIGYFTTNNYFQPCSASLRALHEAKDALAARGHELIPMSISPEMSGWEVCRLYIGFVGMYGNLKEFVDALQGESLFPSYRDIYFIANIPNWLRVMVRPILKLLGEERKRDILKVTRSGGIFARDVWHMCQDLQEFRDRWLDASDTFDCIVSPTVPIPAFLHGTCAKQNHCLTYTFLANLLQWPCGACPVSHVQEDEQTYPVEALPPVQQDSWARDAANILPGSKGMPVGVQILARPFNDELCLFAMKELEEALENRSDK
eukprot:GEMP01019525.1.p1 GENE.GEMP01019525.1~~GEMP01019525.1.p1  ORF type:complete len:610 (+),score=124.28 GEMP01019525.1:116-1945(+)